MSFLLLAFSIFSCFFVFAFVSDFLGLVNGETGTALLASEFLGLSILIVFNLSPLSHSFSKYSLPSSSSSSVEHRMGVREVFTSDKVLLPVVSE